MDKYYVYGLIDPRTNSIFYIGKGKGKRMYQHEKEKEELHTNTEKLSYIKEIQKEGLEVVHEVICADLTEEAALLLERMLVYRLGRKIFGEGNLTNIVPGGRWHKEATLFLKTESIKDIEVEIEKYLELKSVLEKYPHVSKEFKGLQCPYNPLDQNLYVYNADGELINEWDIDNFIQIFGLGHALDLLNVLKDAELPIFAWNRVWSKTRYEKFVNVNEIPFQDFDLVNSSFVQKINNAIENNKDVILDCFYSTGNLHSKINLSFNPKLITIRYFYPNCNIKHFSAYLENLPDGICQTWYPNGQLKEESEHIHNIAIWRKSYFSSGNLEMVENYNVNGKLISLRSWYENGQLKYENNENGTSFSYAETGILITKKVRVNDFNNKEEDITWEFDIEGKVIKESKKYYIKGILHGYERTFYNSGELRREVDFMQGYNKRIIRNFKKSGEPSGN